MIEVSLTYNQLADLLEYTIFVLQNVDNDGKKHTALLIEHIAEFMRIFDKKIKAGSKTYRLRFTSLQALAFKQIFQGMRMPAYHSTIVNKVLAAADRATKQPRKLSAA